MVERFNQTLKRLLSHYVADHQRDWDVQLPEMLMAYQAMPQSSTGYTPAYLLFGKELCLPQDIAYELPTEEIACATQPAYVKDLRLRLAHAHTVVRRKLTNIQKHQAQLHDAGPVAVSLSEGHLVRRRRSPTHLANYVWGYHLPQHRINAVNVTRSKTTRDVFLWRPGRCHDPLAPPMCCLHKHHR